MYRRQMFFFKRKLYIGHYATSPYHCYSSKVIEKIYALKKITLRTNVRKKKVRMLFILLKYIIIYVYIYIHTRTHTDRRK